MTLRALAIPGIQGVPEDWKDLNDQLKGIMQIDQATRVPAIRKEKPDSWRQRALEHESQQIREGAYSILLLQSFGTHRPELIDENGIEAAIMLTPPANSIDPHRKPIAIPKDAQRRGSVEDMLADLILDMRDEETASFIMRQEIDYGERSGDIKNQFGYLRDGPCFSEQLSRQCISKPTLIIQSQGDPWYAGHINEGPNRTVRELGREYGHYPHLSAPELVATLVRDWLSENGLIENAIRTEASYA